MSAHYSFRPARSKFCLPISWSIGWQLSLAKLLNLGRWTGALSCIIQKNGLEFNSTPIPSQTELITPSFRITAQACTYLCYCADQTVLYHITIICLHEWMNSKLFFAFPTTININSLYYIIYWYELPTYLVPTVGNFLIDSILISIILVTKAAKCILSLVKGIK